MELVTDADAALRSELEAELERVLRAEADTERGAAGLEPQGPILLRVFTGIARRAARDRDAALRELETERREVAKLRERIAELECLAPGRAS